MRARTITASVILALLVACRSDRASDETPVIEEKTGEPQFLGIQCGFGCDGKCRFPEQYVCVRWCGQCRPEYGGKNGTICATYALRDFTQCGETHTCPPETVPRDSMYREECQANDSASKEDNAVQCKPITLECMP
jgi:hypothetical protein